MSEAFAGRHLRTQRELGGFSVRALADVMRLSPTRIHQLEDANHVTPQSASRYLDAVAQAWRVRAVGAAVIVERQPERDDAARELVTS